MPVDVEVTNYQSFDHAKFRVEGLTTITGSNNLGKSALLRAVRGVFQNTPGSSFVKNGTNETVVTLVFHDCKIEWRKGRTTKPAYSINDAPPIFPGRGVPDEVQALGIRSIEAGGQDIWPNVAPQFSGPLFLLDKPGSVLAEAVADVKTVCSLNTAIRAAESDVRALGSEIKVRQKDVLQLTRNVHKFTGLDTVAQTIEALKEKEAKINKVKVIGQELIQLNDRLVQANKECNRFNGLSNITLPKAPDDSVINEIRELKALHTRLQAAFYLNSKFRGVNLVDVPHLPSYLGELEVELETLRRYAMRYKNALKRMQHYDGFSVVEVAQVPEEIAQTAGTLNELRVLVGALSQARKRVSDVDKELRDVEAELEEQQHLLPDFETCPTCGALLKGS